MYMVIYWQKTNHELNRTHVLWCSVCGVSFTYFDK